jgi:hypothetical protein
MTERLQTHVMKLTSEAIGPSAGIAEHLYTWDFQQLAATYIHIWNSTHYRTRNGLPPKK